MLILQQASRNKLDLYTEIVDRGFCVPVATCKLAQPFSYRVLQKFLKLDFADWATSQLAIGLTCNKLVIGDSESECSGFLRCHCLRPENTVVQLAS